MANTKAILISEYVIALGVASWAALKAKQAPWPPTIIKTGIAFSLLGFVAYASQELAATLGAGFLIAQLVRVLGGKDPYTGGIPDNGRIQFDESRKRRIAQIQPNEPDRIFRTVLSWKSPGE